METTWNTRAAPSRLVFERAWSLSGAVKTRETKTEERLLAESGTKPSKKAMKCLNLENGLKLGLRKKDGVALGSKI